MAKLGDFFTISSGGTPSKNKPEYYENGTIPWVKTGDLKSKYISSNIEKITQTGVENSSAKVFPKNTVLLAMYGATIGACSILQFEATTNQACAAFLPCDKVLPNYLYYFLSSKKERFVLDGVGGAQPNISAGYLKNIEFDLLPLETQKQIAANLDKVTHTIDLCNNILEKLDLLVKARFVEMFGDPVDNPKNWTTKQLQELVTDDCTISYGIVQTGDDQEDGIPVFRPVDIVNHIPMRSELKKTAKEISNKYKRTILKGREMLITVRANIADTYVIGEEFAGCNVGRGIVPIRTKEDVMILEFLKYQIDSKHLNDNIKALAKGITLIQLNMEDLREVTLIVPPIKKQKHFVEFAKQIDKSKSAVKQVLEKAETLKKALMQEYFG